MSEKVPDLMAALEESLGMRSHTPTDRLRDENEVLRNFLRAMDPAGTSLTPAQFKEKYGVYLSAGGDGQHGD